MVYLSFVEFDIMKTKSGSVFELNYHIVWCPKYRKNIPDKYIESLRTSIISICNSREWEIIEMEIMPDHVHIFIGAKPTDSPASIIKILKGVSARTMFEQFGELKEIWKKGHLWSPSYYVGSVGNVNKETVKKYIENQKGRKVGRPAKQLSSHD